MKAKQFLSRRSAIRLGAVMFPGAVAAAAGIPAVASTAAADPIFAIMAEYERAWTALGDAMNREDEAAEADANREITALSKATWRLADTPPATLAGAIALLQFLQAREHAEDPILSAVRNPKEVSDSRDYTLTVFASLEKSLSKMAA